VVDILSTPDGMDQLLKLGVRKVPCIAVGVRYTFAQNLKDVAEFLGISLEREVLPPGRLVDKYLGILAAAQRMVLQIPTEKLEERVSANRPRTIGSFAHHIFLIAEAFVLSCEGAEFSENINQAQPADGFISAAEIAGYAEKVHDRLARWWETTSDKSCEKPIHTYYGNQTAHELLERCTWHSAQHCRQLANLLECHGIRADGLLTPELLEGLPLPEGLWE
jgi:hypothetical protein